MGYAAQGVLSFGIKNDLVCCIKKMKVRLMVRIIEDHIMFL